MTWREGAVEGCRIVPFRKFTDERGWLAEIFRHDELEAEYHPVMGYLSMTLPGVARGPHEHVKQTDLFVFFSGTFRLYLWDARSDSPTYGNRQVLELGEAAPAAVLVPPGVVHAYRNIDSREGLILNCPNALYAGKGRTDPVDEIRHEETGRHIYIMD